MAISTKSQYFVLVCAALCEVVVVGGVHLVGIIHSFGCWEDVKANGEMVMCLKWWNWSLLHL